MLEKIKKHKKLMIAIVVIVIIAIVVGILVHRTRQSASEITQVDSGIQAFTLQKQDMSSSVSTSGTVESSNVTEVTTEVSSAIKELNVSLGDHVEKGQVLCTFDDEQIRQQIADLEKQNSAAKKASDSTKQKAQRAVETAQAQANAKAAAVAAAQNDYLRNTRYRRVRSISGSHRYHDAKSRPYQGHPSRGSPRTARSHQSGFPPCPRSCFPSLLTQAGRQNRVLHLIYGGYDKKENRFIAR